MSENNNAEDQEINIEKEFEFESCENEKNTFNSLLSWSESWE